MLSVIKRSKFFLVGAITVAMALIFVPFVTMHVFTDFPWWQIIVAYLLFTVPAMIGLALLFGLWPMFEMKKLPRDPEKH